MTRVVRLGAMVDFGGGADQAEVDERHQIGSRWKTKWDGGGP